MSEDAGPEWYFFREIRALPRDRETRSLGTSRINTVPEAHCRQRPTISRRAVCSVAQSCPTHYDPMDCSPPGSSVHGDSPGKNTRVGCHFLLQGIFPTQGSNPGSNIAGRFFTVFATREDHHLPQGACNQPQTAGACCLLQQEWDMFRENVRVIAAEGNGNPLQCSCLENPRDGGAWWAAVYGVARSRTQLKRLSSSSRSTCDFQLRTLTFSVACKSHHWQASTVCRNALGPNSAGNRGTRQRPRWLLSGWCGSGSQWPADHIRHTDPRCHLQEQRPVT